MSSCAYPQLGPSQRSSLTPLLAWSVALHISLCVAVPLALRVLMQPKKFQRPQTFQIISLPSLKSPSSRSSRAPAPKKAVEPAPGPKAASKSDAKPEPKTEENLDELNDLLDEVSTPMQVGSVSGNFKYHWYLNAVEQKSRRYWNPPTESGNDSVIVAFTIFSTGEISDVKVVQSSGQAMLDNLATRAFTLAAPFGKLPPGFSENRLELTWTLKTIRQ